MPSYIGPVFFAVVAAVGNALYAMGQKKAENVSNPLTFIFICLVFTALLELIFSPVAGRLEIVSALKNHWGAALISSGGLFLVYVGFYYLFSKYGVNSYVLYAVLSIVTTSVGVGIFVFREHFNVYHLLSLVAAVVTVLLFSIGQMKH